MKKLCEYCFIAMLGGAGYMLIEVLWRGFTHRSMGVAGAVCMLWIYRIQMLKKRFLEKCVLCAIAITLTELVFGITVNIILKLNVWDYSERRFNFLGQICPEYCFLWGALSAGVLPVCRIIRKVFR